MSLDFDDLEAVREPEGRNLLVVDGLNLAFRWKHRGARDFAEEYISTIQSLAKSYSCGNIIVTADWGGSRYRKEVHPEYKANRKEKYANQTEEEKEAAAAFFDDYEASLSLCEEFYPVIRYKGVEADDLAAYISQECKDDYEHIWLVSSDKDWDALVSDKVSRFSYVTRKETTVDNWDMHYPELPQEVFYDYKALVGDKGDNIDGVDLIGPKRATQLLQQYGSVFDIIDSLPLPGTAKYINNLNNSEELLYRNMELVDLHSFMTEAIGKENIEDCKIKLTSMFLVD